jgi:hypothetical protein
MLERHDEPYVLSIRGSERLEMGHFRPHTAEDLAVGPVMRNVDSRIIDLANDAFGDREPQSRRAEGRTDHLFARALAQVERENVVDGAT